ncbi:MAG: hypothetical protein MZV70_54590 [Desulfobacterales bacterium]|nr:hypothetical protein [Desulfobacterales bacterium]
MLGDLKPLPFIATFHALCLRLLQELNPNEAVTLIDEYEQAELIAEAAEQVAESGIPVSLTPQALQERIMRAKQSMISPDRLAPAESTPPEDEAVSALSIAPTNNCLTASGGWISRISFLSWSIGWRRITDF